MKNAIIGALTVLVIVSGVLHKKQHTKIRNLKHANKQLSSRILRCSVLLHSK